MPECHSTNSLALELGQKEDLPEGTVIITSNQTQGRGQKGNTWISEPGKNLTLSVVFKPGYLAIKDQFALNMVTSLAVRDLVKENIKNESFVKWPNDIIVENQKICGILIENQIQGSSFSKSIIGIGLNVNQRAFFSRSATSLSMLSGNTFDLKKIFEGLMVKLEYWLMLLRQGALMQIKNAYTSSLYGNEEWRNYRGAEGAFEGMVRGIDESGKLIIETKMGIKHFNFKEVQFDFEPLK